MAHVLPFRPSQCQLSRVWDAYEQARRHAEALFADPQSTRQERMEADMEANRLHRVFYRLCLRLEARNG